LSLLVKIPKALILCKIFLDTIIRDSRGSSFIFKNILDIWGAVGVKMRFVSNDFKKGVDVI